MQSEPRAYLSCATKRERQARGIESVRPASSAAWSLSFSLNPSTKKRCPKCVVRHGWMTATRVTCVAQIDVSGLSISALATNAVVNRRCANAQLMCQTRHASVLSAKLATRVTPCDRERDFGRIQAPRASGFPARMVRRNPAVNHRSRVADLKASLATARSDTPSNRAKSRSVPCERRNSIASWCHFKTLTICPSVNFRGVRTGYSLPTPNRFITGPLPARSEGHSARKRSADR